MNVKFVETYSEAHFWLSLNGTTKNSWLSRVRRTSLRVAEHHDVPADACCKTVGCIAGWACALEGKQVRNGMFSHTAEKVLIRTIAVLQAFRLS